MDKGREEETARVRTGICGRVCLFQGGGGSCLHHLVQVQHLMKSCGDRDCYSTKNAGRVLPIQQILMNS